MQGITIWHNPRCSKSRATLALLEAQGHEPQVVLYLDNPPSVKELKAVLKSLDCKPRELMRTKESLYRELGLADEQNDQALIRAMNENPKLIERPVVMRGNRAAIGRPPENVLRLL